MADIPEDVPCPNEVKEVLMYDELYRKELAKRKYIHEYRMLPPDEPVKDFNQNYHIPAAGVDLGISLGNLSKNVSVWKKRLNDPRYPDAAQKHGMYEALYRETKTKVAAERARVQSLANDARNNS